MRATARIMGAALVAAVLVSGCGSSHSGAGTTNNENKQATSGTGKKPTAAPAQRLARDGMKGTWLSGSGAGPDVLTIVGNKVTITGERRCSGRLHRGGEASLDLRCDGRKSRSYGAVVVSPDGRALSVSWDDGREDAFAKTQMPAQLPEISGLGER